ncbi:MAG: NAD(P)-dependent oxidoreductase [Proteobacteria bacterium]|nr:NAD(P)-dependent oxidoreductase [Pseudomonadota bacterium]
MLTHARPAATKPERVVLVGAGGFIGRTLQARLEREDVATLPLGRTDFDLAADGADRTLAGLLLESDAVVFLSAITPDRDRGRAAFLANTRMGANFCAAIETRPVAHVVYVSSDAVYPFRTALIDETVPAEPADLYGAMHRARELMVLAAARCPVAVLRPTAVWGDGDTHNGYGPNRFARQAAQDGCVMLFGGGEETRDHIAISDVADLMRLTLFHRSAGLLNLASGRSVSFRALADSIAARRSPPAAVVESPRAQPVTHRHFDVSALRRAFPEFVPGDVLAAPRHRP